MFLITGFPRSATHYTKTLMNGIGLNVKGEEYGRTEKINPDEKVDGVVSWQHLNLHKDKIDVILHQVRNPLKVLSSSQTLFNNTLRKIFKQIEAPYSWGIKLHFRKFDMINEKQLLYYLMYSWLFWNELIENDKRVVYRYKVEEISNEWSNILDNLSLKKVELPEISKETNTRKGKYKNLTIEDLYETDKELTEKIINKAKFYGYDL